MERDRVKEQANQREKKKKKRDTQVRYNKEKKKTFDKRSEDRILEPAVFFGCEGVL